MSRAKKYLRRRKNPRISDCMSTLKRLLKFLTSGSGAGYFPKNPYAYSEIRAALKVVGHSQKRYKKGAYRGWYLDATLNPRGRRRASGKKRRSR